MNIQVETDGNIVIVRQIGAIDALAAPATQDAMNEVLGEQPAHTLLTLV